MGGRHVPLEAERLRFRLRVVLHENEIDLRVGHAARLDDIFHPCLLDQRPHHHRFAPDLAPEKLTQAAVKGQGDVEHG